MKNLDNLLKSKNLKITEQRLAVLQIISQRFHPLSIQDITSELSKKNLSIDKVTIYRIIDKFLEKQIIRQIDFHDNKIRYELNNDHHHHLVCKICGKIQPIYEACLNIDTNKILKDYDFSVEDHSLEFFGKCKDCLGK